MRTIRFSPFACDRKFMNMVGPLNSRFSQPVDQMKNKEGKYQKFIQSQPTINYTFSGIPMI